MTPSKPPPRNNTRRNLRVPIRVEVTHENETSRGYAINISPTGMGLQSIEPHKPGMRLSLRFRFTDVDPWICWLMVGIEVELPVTFRPGPSTTAAFLDQECHRMPFAFGICHETIQTKLLHRHSVCVSTDLSQTAAVTKFGRSSVIENRCQNGRIKCRVED